MTYTNESLIWYACAEYADGTRIEKYFPYYEDGDYEKEEERQYELEAWLLGKHEGCIWYSVGCEERI